MKMALPEIRPEERTPLVEALLGVIRQLLDRVQQLEETVQQLRDDNALLKGQKPKPPIKPSQLESPPPRPPAEGVKRPGSQKRSKNAELTIHHEVPLHPPNLPEGAVFKGYEPFVVQDLKIECQNTRYLRARYELPTGGSVLAPLPADVLPDRHFGPGLICYVLDQHHDARVTQPLLLEQLHDFGIDISAGQLSRLLTENHDTFHEEKAEMLTAGLETASYIGTDDTGARHQGKNGYCTVISHELFAYFESTACKSRLNFLQVLQGGACSYAINETTLAYWERQKLAAAVVQKLKAGSPPFADASAWQAWLAELAIADERHVRIATEGALLGGLIERGVSPELVILSDGAPQFDLLQHASCWIHAERPLARLVPHNDEHRAAIETVRARIWELYRDLKAYRQQPDAAQKPLLEARFDTLVGQQTGYPSINGVLKEMRDHRADLLRVLERPEVPLHNNASESDIREYVTKRKISGSTRSDSGRRSRDTFASLKKTCRKLGVRFWDYLQDRVRGLGQIARLADLIRQRAKARDAALA
ncbi:MAG: transposase [Burkholderiales bacterium]|nr:transposase [Burkholderiales bacterium]